MSVREKTMRVRVKFFATLRSSVVPGMAPGTPFEVKVREGTMVDELITLLKLPRDEVKVVFVNGRARPVDWPLQEGDELGIFPPIGGG